MTRLLLSTAILAASALTASAQDVEIFRGAADPLEIRASDLMGMRIYASEAVLETDQYEGIQEGWEDIGEVNDVILSRDGSVQAVLVDIGGFLGIGERQVAVSMGGLRFVADSATAEDADDYYLVMNATRENLEAAPAYVVGETSAEAAAAETDSAVDNAAATTAAAAAGTVAAVEGAAAETADAAEGTVAATGDAVADAGAEVADEASDAAAEVSEEVAQADMTDTQEDAAEAADTAADAGGEAVEETAEAAEATGDASADVAEDAADATVAAATNEEGELVRTPIEREGFLSAEADYLTADRLQGAAVYDTNDDRVGEVSELLLSDGGQVTDVVVDVGGFLGIGEKPVAMPMDQLTILRQEGGEEVRVYVSNTREELEGMTTYEN